MNTSDNAYVPERGFGDADFAVAESHPSQAPRIPHDEYGERRDLAAHAAAARGLNGLLVWSMGGARLDSFGDVFYLSNHYSSEQVVLSMGRRTGYGHAALVLPIHDSPTLLVNAGWRPDLVCIDQVEQDSDLYGLVLDCMKRSGLSTGKIGLVREELIPLSMYRELTQAFPGIEFVRADEILEELRMVKSKAELQLMRHAQTVGAAILTAMLSEVAIGRTDADLVGLGHRMAANLGATPYEFILASGPDSEHYAWSRLPAFDPRRPYTHGDLVHPDVYGCVDGYFYDIQRTTVVGSASDPQRHLLESAVAVVEHICDQVRPGRRASEIYASTMEWIADHGWDDPAHGTETGGVRLLNSQRFGHGLGLGFEDPRIRPGDATVLRPGMTLAIEMWLTHGNGESAFHEETVAVTQSGADIMTAGCGSRWWN